MKGREVYDILKTRGVDPELLKILVKLAEEQHAMARAIPAMATSFESLSHVLTQHTMIFEHMKKDITEFRKRFNDVRSLGTDEG